jgi:hypothetical protein
MRQEIQTKEAIIATYKVRSYENNMRMSSYRSIDKGFQLDDGETRGSVRKKFVNLRRQ